MPLLHAHAPRSMPMLTAACSLLNPMHSAPCSRSLPRSLCSVLYVPCSMLHAPCSMLQAPCSILHGLSSAPQLSAPCSVLRAQDPMHSALCTLPPAPGPCSVLFSLCSIPVLSACRFALHFPSTMVQVLLFAHSSALHACHPPIYWWSPNDLPLSALLYHLSSLTQKTKNGS